MQRLELLELDFSDDGLTERSGGTFGTAETSLEITLNS
jgi:hypothetical protein